MWSQTTKCVVICYRSNRKLIYVGNTHTHTTRSCIFRHLGLSLLTLAASPFPALLRSGSPVWLASFHAHDSSLCPREGPYFDLVWMINYSWPLNNMGLNCVCPLIHGFFSINTAVLHDPWLDESSRYGGPIDREGQLQSSLDFQLWGWGRVAPPNSSHFSRVN